MQHHNGLEKCEVSKAGDQRSFKSQQALKMIPSTTTLHRRLAMNRALDWMRPGPFHHGHHNSICAHQHTAPHRSGVLAHWVTSRSRRVLRAAVHFRLGRRLRVYNCEQC